MGRSKDKAKCASSECEGGKAEKKSKAVKAKAKGKRWVNPYLSVRDVTASLEWYERAFGFKTVMTMPGQDGKPIHAELRHKKSVIMIGPDSPTAVRAAPKGEARVSLYCYCDDVDAIAASARAAGA